MTIQSYKEDGRPSQQWFWDDWFSAFDVRLCSLAARGLWVDMLGVMFKAEIRGTLTVNGRQVDNKTLANLTNSPSVGEMKSCLKELERNNVFSRLDDDTIYCRRMFRESTRKEELSRIRAQAGKKGAKKRWQKDSKEDGKKNSESMAKMASFTSSPSSIPTVTPSPKDIWQKKFNDLWKIWPLESRGKKLYCLTKFLALCKKEKKLEIFIKVQRGYFQFLEYQEKVNNFKQKCMHLSTFLNNWEGDKEKYEDFKYEPPM